MAEIDINQYTLLEQLKGQVGGNILQMAEIIEADNPIIKDAPTFEANDGTTHLIQRETYLPGGSKRKYNEYVGRDEPRSDNVREGMEMVETFAVADKALVDKSSSPKTERIKRVSRFIRGMSKTMMTDIVYSDADGSPEAIDGWQKRRNALGDYCISAGGTTADVQSSIYLVEYGDQKAYLLHPKGSGSKGVEHNDLGVTTATDPSDATKEMIVYKDWFKIHFGFALENERALIRICNVESSAVASTLPNFILRGISRLPSGGGGILYCNRDVKAELDILAMNKSNGFYTSKDIFGRPVTMFQQTMIRLLPVLTKTEAVLS